MEQPRKDKNENPVYHKEIPKDLHLPSEEFEHGGYEFKINTDIENDVFSIKVSYRLDADNTAKHIGHIKYLSPVMIGNEEYAVPDVTVDTVNDKTGYFENEFLRIENEIKSHVDSGKIKILS